MNEDNNDHVRESIDTFKNVVLDTIEELRDAMEFLKKEIEGKNLFIRILRDANEDIDQLDVSRRNKQYTHSLSRSSSNTHSLSKSSSDMETTPVFSSTSEGMDYVDDYNQGYSNCPIASFDNIPSSNDPTGTVKISLAN